MYWFLRETYLAFWDLKDRQQTRVVSFPAKKIFSPSIQYYRMENDTWNHHIHRLRTNFDPPPPSRCRSPPCRVSGTAFVGPITLSFKPPKHRETSHLLSVSPFILSFGLRSKRQLIMAAPPNTEPGVYVDRHRGGRLSVVPRGERVWEEPAGSVTWVRKNVLDQCICWGLI